MTPAIIHVSQVRMFGWNQILETADFSTMSTFWYTLMMYWLGSTNIVFPWIPYITSTTWRNHRRSRTNTWVPVLVGKILATELLLGTSLLTGNLKTPSVFWMRSLRLPERRHCLWRQILFFQRNIIRNCISPLRYDDDSTNYYQNQIHILMWAVELVRIGICVQVSDMSRYLAAPQTVHLEIYCIYLHI